jgi:hypothetical protein
MVNKERVGALIEKLKEQFNNDAPANFLLITAHQLQAALLNVNNIEVSATIVENKPTESPITVIDNNITSQTAQTTIVPSPQVTNNVNQAIIDNQAIEEKPELPNNNNNNNTAPNHNETVKPTENQNNNNQNTIAATLELNDKLAEKNNTLNDVLQNNTTMLADVLDEGPIADLKKAFSINEKFIIVQQLFRNDSDMYERSLKTLNGFANKSEALSWMEREFITNLAWDKQNETVINFYNKVNRRFSN